MDIVCLKTKKRGGYEKKTLRVYRRVASKSKNSPAGTEINKFDVFAQLLH